MITGPVTATWGAQYRVKTTAKGFAPPAVAHVRVAEIIAAVAEATGVNKADILAHRRTINSTGARLIVYYLARELTKYSFAQIGSIVRRDHSTIMNGCEKVELRMQSEPEFAALIDQLLRRLRGAP